MSEYMSVGSCETVSYDRQAGAVVIIDQTLLPNEVRMLSLRTPEELWEAIYLLKVRGAPAIGVAAAYGMALFARQIECRDYEGFLQEFRRIRIYLDFSRPTAVNLSWALGRMERVVTQSRGQELSVILDRLDQEAESVRQEDVLTCRRLGEYGLTLLRPGDGILTHCNAGQLATSRYGTATAPIYLGQERGYGFRVYADETRPLLQGARLTSYELSAAGVDVTLICDNMAASVMKNGWVNAVFVGCDRVATNGDTANKIGTLGVAILAARYGVPFYVCAPTSTIDLDTPSGEDIPIEQRPADEVTRMWYEKPMAPEGVKVYNPAFDVTDHELIAGIVTEYGIARAPYEVSFREIFRRKGEGRP